MRIIIYGHNLELEPGVAEYAERRLLFALGRFSWRVREVNVRFTDLNADRGGVDKQCRIVAQLIPTGIIVAEDRDLSPYAAVAGAAQRIGRGVARELRRRQEARSRGYATSRKLAPFY